MYPKKNIEEIEKTNKKFKISITICLLIWVIVISSCSVAVTSIARKEGIKLNKESFKIKGYPARFVYRF